MTSRAAWRRRALTALSLLAVHAASTSALAAPSVAPARPLVPDLGPLQPTNGPEYLAGNGELGFAAFITSAQGQTVLRGTFVRAADDAIALEHGGQPISSQLPRSTDPRNADLRASLTMNSKGTVLGTFAGDLFRVTEGASAGSLNVSLRGRPAGELLGATATADASVLLGDRGGSGTFLVAHCTADDCVAQWIGNDGAALGAPQPVFQFTAAGEAPPTVRLAGTALPDGSYLLLASDGQRVHHAHLTTPEASVARTELPLSLAAECIAPQLTSLRVGFHALTDEAVLRATTTCPEQPVLWQNLAGVGFAEAACGTLSATDECQLVATPAGLYASYGDVLKGIGQENAAIPSGTLSLRLAALSPSQLLIADGFNALLALPIAPDGPEPLRAPEHRTRRQATQFDAIARRASADAPLVASASDLIRLQLEDGSAIEVGMRAQLLQPLEGDRLLLGNASALHLLEPTGEELDLGGNTRGGMFRVDRRLVTLVTRSAAHDGSVVLGLAALDTEQLVEAGLADSLVPQLGPSFVAVTDLPLLDRNHSGARLAFDGEQFAVLVVEGQRLVMRRFDTQLQPIGDALVLAERAYGPAHALDAVGLPQGGGFVVAWQQSRRSVLGSEIYASFVDREGVVSTPEGFRVAPTHDFAQTPMLVVGADAEHPQVYYTNFASERRAHGTLHAVTLSRAQQRSLTPARLTQSGYFQNAAVLPGAANSLLLVAHDYASANAVASVLAFDVQGGKPVGDACEQARECVTDVCTAGACAEADDSSAPSCPGACAELDASTQSCVPVAQGTMPRDGACPGYLCNGEAMECPANCQNDAQCTGNAECIEGTCTIVRSCSGPSELTDAGKVSSCGAYRCDEAQSACFSQCFQTAQCSDGFVCDAQGACVTPPEADQGGCHVGAKGRGGAGGGVTVLGTLAVLGVLRRWRRRGSAALAAGGLATGMVGSAHAASVSPPVAIPSGPGTSFNPIAQITTGVPMLMPGPARVGVMAVEAQQRSMDVRLGATGIVGAVPARAPLQNNYLQCTDGSWIRLQSSAWRGATRHALQRFSLEGESLAPQDLPVRPLRGVRCNAEGAWLLQNGVASRLEYMKWDGTVARSHAVEGEVVAVLGDAAREAWWTVVPTPGGSELRLFDHTGAQLSSEPILQLRQVLPMGNKLLINLLRIDATPVTLVYELDANGVPALIAQPVTGVLPGFELHSLVLDGPNRLYGRVGSTIGRIELGDDPAAADYVRYVSVADLGVNVRSALALRGTALEVLLGNGQLLQVPLDELPSTPSAPEPLSTAPARTLLRAAGAGEQLRAIAIEGASGTVSVRRSGLASTVPLPPGYSPAHLLPLDDGRAYLLARSGYAQRGFVLSSNDTLSDHPAFDGLSTAAVLSNGLAAVGIEAVLGDKLQLGLLHTSAAYGEQRRSVEVLAPVAEWGLRNSMAVAPVGTVAYAVYTARDSAVLMDQHLHWARIAQDEVSEPKPLTTAFLGQKSPSIACDPSGVRGCLVAWEDYRRDNEAADVYAARILPDGSTPDGDGFALAVSANQETEPQVIWADDGDHFFVAWRDSVPGDRRAPGQDPSMLRGAFVAHTGEVADVGGMVLTSEPLDEGAPQLTEAKDGVITLVYEVTDAVTASTTLASRTIDAGLAKGSACTRDDECAGRACLDGVCCEAACRGGCGSCNDPGALGVCKPRPRGAAPTVDSCGAFLCNGEDLTCATQCERDSDCVDGAQCDGQSRSCEAPSRGAGCVDEFNEKLSDGGSRSCAPYLCQLGGCLNRCTSHTDCAGDALCTASGQCEAAPAAAEGGCDAGGGQSSQAASLSVAALAAAAVLSRLARKRRPAFRS